MKLEPHDFTFCPLCNQSNVQLAGVAIILPTKYVKEFHFQYINLKRGMEGNSIFDVDREKLELDVDSGVVLFFHCRDCDHQWRKYVTNFEECVVSIEQNGDDPFADLEEEDDDDEDEEDDDDEGEEWKNQ